MQTPPPFEYARARSVDDAIALLERHGPEARIVAGGHSLLPMMKLRLATPEHLVDINDLADLDYIREEAGEVRIGALTRHRVVDARRALVLERCRYLHNPLPSERLPARDAPTVRSPRSTPS